jgi:hypothetical protein
MRRRNIHDRGQSGHVQWLIQVLQHVRNAVFHFSRNIRFAMAGLVFTPLDTDTEWPPAVHLHLLHAIAFHLCYFLSV